MIERQNSVSGFKYSNKQLSKMFGVSLNFVKKFITKKVPKKAINFFPKTLGQPLDDLISEIDKD